MSEDPQFKLILFDLEGTLVDFQWRLKDAVKEILPVLTCAGIDPFQYGESPSYADLHNTARDMAKTFPPQKAVGLFKQLDAIYDKYDRDALTRWSPYPDTLTVLDKLSAKSYRMGIVSNIGSYAVKTVLNRFNLLEYFKIVLSRNDVSYLKPNPDGLELALDRLCIPKSKTLFVGDSLNDIVAANRISMPSCFLLGGESRITHEKGDIATFQIPSLSGLVKILILNRQ
jgi:HAD superfamily hydrolase (TIGR01549 family)